MTTKNAKQHTRNIVCAILNVPGVCHYLNVRFMPPHLQRLGSQHQRPLNKTTMKTAILATLLATAAAFAPVPQVVAPRSTSSSLSMAKSADEGKTFAASALAAAYLLTSVVSADAALAMDNDFYSTSSPSFMAGDSSSIMLAGRSGGRAGGRSAPRAAPRVSAPSGGTTVINRRTTIVAPPVVMGGGGYGYGGYGGGYGGYYDPTPGLVFGAVNAIGTGMREGRQNAQIAEERAQLQASQERERDMAERIRQLEMMQMQGNKGEQMPPQYYQQMPPPQYAQPPVQVAAPQQ